MYSYISSFEEFCSIVRILKASLAEVKLFLSHQPESCRGCEVVSTVTAFCCPVVQLHWKLLQHPCLEGGNVLQLIPSRSTLFSIALCWAVLDAVPGVPFIEHDGRAELHSHWCSWLPAYLHFGAKHILDWNHFITTKNILFLFLLASFLKLWG